MKVAECVIDTCRRPIRVKSRGWCSAHYSRWQKHGDPLAHIPVKEPPPKVCCVDGCESEHYGHGYCNLHYQRWRKHGDTFTTERHFTNEERFAAYTREYGDCLLWTAALDEWGYGVIWLEGGKHEKAHRYAWERVNGPIPDGMEIDYKYHCDRSCVNTEHLRLATRTGNARHLSGPHERNQTNARNVYARPSGKYQVVVQKNGKNHSFGRYNSIDEAAAVAERARKELFGEFAGLG